MSLFLPVNFAVALRSQDRFIIVGEYLAGAVGAHLIVAVLDGARDRADHAGAETYSGVSFQKMSSRIVDGPRRKLGFLIH